MALKVPDASELSLLNMTKSGLGATCRSHLYSNNYTPADGDTVANYTECVFPSYSFATLSSWSVASEVGGVAQMQHPPVTFTRGSGGTGDQCFGYYVTDAANNLLWAERDPSSPI